MWNRRNLLWLAAYLVLMGVVVTGLWRVRQWSLRTLASAQAQDDWKQWLDAAREQSEGSGPVQRRVPSSPQPPTLVLMSEHFGTCLALALVLSSAMFVTLMIMTMGVLSSPPPTIFTDDQKSEPQPPTVRES